MHLRFIVIDFAEPGNCEGTTVLFKEGEWGSVKYECTITGFQCSGGTAMAYTADCAENGSCTLEK